MDLSIEWRKTTVIIEIKKPHENHSGSFCLFVWLKLQPPLAPSTSDPRDLCFESHQKCKVLLTSSTETKCLIANKQLQQPFFCVEIHLRFRPPFWIWTSIGANIVSTPFVLPLYDLQNEGSHDRGTFKFLQLSSYLCPTFPTWFSTRSLKYFCHTEFGGFGWWLTHPTMSKGTLNYPYLIAFDKLLQSYGGGKDSCTKKGVFISTIISSITKRMFVWM